MPHTPAPQQDYSYNAFGLLLGIAANLAFEVEGPQRSVVLGICRRVGVQLLVDRAGEGCGEARVQ